MLDLFDSELEFLLDFEVGELFLDLMSERVESENENLICRIRKYIFGLSNW